MKYLQKKFCVIVANTFKTQGVTCSVNELNCVKLTIDINDTYISSASFGCYLLKIYIALNILKCFLSRENYIIN